MTSIDRVTDDAYIHCLGKDEYPLQVGANLGILLCKGQESNPCHKGVTRLEGGPPFLQPTRPTLIHN